MGTSVMPVALLLCALCLHQVHGDPAPGTLSARFGNVRPYYAKPNYGVLFRPTHDYFVPTDSTQDIFFTLSLPQLPVFPEPPHLRPASCSEVSHDDLKPASKLLKASYFTHILSTSRFSEDATTARLNGQSPQLYHHYLNSHLSQDDMANQIIQAKRDACFKLMRYARRTAIRYDALRLDINDSYTGLLRVLQSYTIRDPALQKRALLSFLTPAFQSIFGLASEKQIAALQRNIKILQSNLFAQDNKTDSIILQMTQLANITSRRIDNIWQALDRTTNNVQYVLRNLQRLANTSAAYFNRFDASVANIYRWYDLSTTLHDNMALLMSDVALVKSQLAVWHESIITLAKGYLAEHLIPPTDLTSALNTAKLHLLNKRPGFRLIHEPSDLAYYYAERLAKLFVHIHVNGSFSLYVHCKVPLTTMDVGLDVFQVIIVPVPLHSNTTVPQLGYTKLEEQHEYFVVSKTKQTYAQLTARDYNYCTALLDNTCPPLSLLRDHTYITCLAAIFFDDSGRVAEVCNFTYVPYAPPPSYGIYVTGGTYLVSTKSNEIIIQCPGQVRHTHSAYFMLITLPCACSFMVNEVFTPPSLATCDREPTHYYVSYPLNFVQASLFQLPDALPSLSSVEPLPSVPQLHVPDMSSLIDLSKFRHTDQKLLIDLQKHTIKPSNTEGRLSQIKEVPLSDGAFDWSFSFMISTATVNILWSLVLSIIIVILFLRYRAIVMTLALLTVQPKAAAFVVSNPPTTPTQSTTILQPTIQFIDWPLIIPLIILVACSLLLTVYILCLRHHFKNRHILRSEGRVITVIEVVFTTIHDHQFVRLFTIPACVSTISFTSLPTISRVILGNAFLGKTYIDLAWDGPFEFDCFDTRFSIQAPIHFHASDKLASLLLAASQQQHSFSPTIHACFRALCSCGCHKSKLASMSFMNKLTGADSHINHLRNVSPSASTDSI